MSAFGIGKPTHFSISITIAVALKSWTSAIGLPKPLALRIGDTKLSESQA